MLHRPLYRRKAGYSFIRSLNPAAWFRAGVGQTVTGSGVSTWADQSGNGRDLLQGTDAARPALQADGSVLFNGTSHYLKCNAFTLNQPETVYLAFKQVSWTNNDVLIDGNTTGTMYVFQAGLTPSLSWYAGTLPGQTVSLALNTVGVVSAVYNGASSVMQLNLSTPVTGNVGAGNAGGLCVGTVGGATTGWANFQAYEILVFPAANDATQRARIIQYLAGRHGIAL